MGQFRFKWPGDLTMLKQHLVHCVASGGPAVSRKLAESMWMRRCCGVLSPLLYHPWQVVWFDIRPKKIYIDLITVDSGDKERLQLRTLLGRM